MKYNNKEYKWFSISFEDIKPGIVILYKNDPYSAGFTHEAVTTFWENEKLTEKPIIVYEEKV